MDINKLIKLFTVDTASEFSLWRRCSSMMEDCIAERVANLASCDQEYMLVIFFRDNTAAVVEELQFLKGLHTPPYPFVLASTVVSDVIVFTKMRQNMHSSLTNFR